jgi:hypothetical protein
VNTLGHFRIPRISEFHGFREYSLDPLEATKIKMTQMMGMEQAWENLLASKEEGYIPYYRKSKLDGRDNLSLKDQVHHILNSQELDISSHCRMNGIPLITGVCFWDVKSGSLYPGLNRNQRPGAWCVEQALKMKHVLGFVVVCHSRHIRGMAKSFVLEERRAPLKKNFISITEPHMYLSCYINSRCTGPNYPESALGCTAKWVTLFTDEVVRQNIIDFTKRSATRRQKCGLASSGIAPFGFRFVYQQILDDELTVSHLNISKELRIDEPVPLIRHEGEILQVEALIYCESMGMLPKEMIVYLREKGLSNSFRYAGKELKQRSFREVCNLILSGTE